MVFLRNRDRLQDGRIPAPIQRHSVDRISERVRPNDVVEAVMWGGIRTEGGGRGGEREIHNLPLGILPASTRSR